MGSEHTLNGERFPIELHIVHARDGVDDPLNTPKGLAVTGFFFELDAEDNEALKPLSDTLVNILSSGSEHSLMGSGFRIDHLIREVAPVEGPLRTVYSYYQGSLTTPGCNEVVEWILFLTPLKISLKQLELFRALMDSEEESLVDNFRPVQELSGRQVTFYGP